MVLSNRTLLAVAAVGGSKITSACFFHGWKKGPQEACFGRGKEDKFKWMALGLDNDWIACSYHLLYLLGVDHAFFSLNQGLGFPPRASELALLCLP